jgi:hypothetical protein
VLVKTFLLAGKYLETRLFVRFGPEQWVGYSYEWDDSQTEATLVPRTGKLKEIAGATQSWYFPARNDCLECHNKTVGYSLGLETRQLDRLSTYPNGLTVNQLDTLEHLGILDAPPARLPPLADSTASLESRARAYLHANCATCHRPDGDYADIDLRAHVPLSRMNVCNVEPNKGNLGVAGARRLAPGVPSRSLLLLRMLAPDADSGRMPQLATSVLDEAGIALVSAWIDSVAACP